MIRLDNYVVHKEFYRSTRRVYYSGERKSDGLPVVIKTLHPDHLSELSLVQISSEYQFFKEIDIKGIPGYLAFEKYEKRPALVMEDMGRITPLKKLIQSQPFIIEEWLTIFESIACILDRLHSHNIVHTDLSSDHIFIDVDQHRAWILDAGMAAWIQIGNCPNSAKESYHTELAYISPEQTGRMNRKVDYRTDFYSLGVIFYECLTGRLPFIETDPLTLVHSHLAKKTMPPSAVNPEIPESVSLIVMKLLSKTAGSRYQGVYGLKHDLKECLAQISTNGIIRTFEPGLRDISEQFRISGKLYGRDMEIQKCLKIADNVWQGNMECITVSGKPGVGKTFFVQEALRLLAPKQGFFITGKFDQYQHDIPYSALKNSFRGLVRQSLMKNDIFLDNLKNQLIEALGQNGGIISDLIPDVEYLIGSQAPLKAPNLDDTHNLFNRVCINFIRVFCKPEHPLVFFLDDIQWIDAASLNFLESIVHDDSINCLLLIMAYRDNEIAGDHHVVSLLDAVDSRFEKKSQITVKPLNFMQVSGFLSDTFQKFDADINALAELVIRKTGGNPFAIHQFLTAMRHDRLLAFNPVKGRWTWDLSRIQQQNITDNVADLLIQRLKGLPQKTQDTLALSACIGSRVDLNILAFLMKAQKSRVYHVLKKAIEYDLIEPVTITDASKEQVSEKSGVSDTYRFQHDRIQQAAYGLFSIDERKKAHLNIGRYLLEKNTDNTIEEYVFDVVHHLNQSIDCVKTQKEINLLARLNLQAGKRARISTAYENACQYLLIGMKLLREDGWRNSPNLTLALYTQGVEAARLNGDYELMDRLIDAVIDHTGSALDQVNVYKSRIQKCMAENNITQAVETAMAILEKLGEAIEKNPTDNVIRETLASSLDKIRDVKVETLISLPKMDAPEKQSAMRILATVTSAAYIGAPELFPLIVCKSVQLSITYGNAPESPMAYAAFGVILCKWVNDIESGYQFGQLALALMEQCGAKEYEAKVYHATSCYITHWKDHIRDTLAPALKGYQAGLETGDFEFSGYGVYCYGMHAFLAGNRLDDVEQDMTRYGQAVKRLKQETPFQYNEIFHQTVLNLISAQTENPGRLAGHAYDEIKMVPVHENANDRLALLFYYFCRMTLHYLFGEPAAAYENAKLAKKELKRASGGPFVLPVFVFYDALIRLDLCRISKNTKEIETYIEDVQKSLDQLEDWSRETPENHQHRFHLVKAEYYRVTSKLQKASHHYDQAIRLANRHGFINDEALGYELMGRLCLDSGMSSSGVLFIKKAYGVYSEWGALQKCERMRRQFKSIITGDMSHKSSSASFHGDKKYTDGKSGVAFLDMMTLVKASQVISGEFELDRLLAKLMRFVIENAGAQKGMLLLHSKGELMMGVYGISDGETIAMKPLAPVSKADHIPMGVISYVKRTREIWGFDSKPEPVFLKEDPYLRKFKPKSVLCMPVLHKSSLVGILYLENRMVADAFSSDRLKVLKLLCAQIAISIDNSKLYADLKNAEEKYRSIFENAIEGIFQTSPEGRFITANPAMASILGYESVDDLMQQITDIGYQLYVSKTARNEFINLIRKRGNVSGFEMEFRRKDGSCLWASLHARTVFNSDGSVRLIEGIFSDITRQKRLTMDLQKREAFLRKENIRLKSNINDRYRFGSIIGKSAGMQKVYELIERASLSTENVIVYGESGTGKELVARAIHDAGDRREKPFVTIHCGAIPTHLFESELFGYKKGAFTGANRDTPGFLDQADTGTLFLDELGEIDLNNQVRLLRVLEDGGFTPVGGRQRHHPDVRIIAATNKKLREQVDQGLMREDFFYRVHVIPIHLPALKDRMEDIPLLIDHFMRIHNSEKKALPLSGDMLEQMLNHDWPGNVRELRNTIHRYITLNQFVLKTRRKARKYQALIPIDETLEGFDGNSYSDVMRSFEKKLFLSALEKHQWHRGNTAESLGIPRRTFFRKIKKMGLVK